MVAVGAIAHHERVKHDEREAEAYNQGLNEGYVPAGSAAVFMVKRIAAPG